MYIYIGLFKDGKLIEQIGKSVLLPKNSEQRAAVIALIELLTSKIDAQYSPIDREYIAYDYRQ